MKNIVEGIFGGNAGEFRVVTSLGHFGLAVGVERPRTSEFGGWEGGSWRYERKSHNLGGAVNRQAICRRLSGAYPVHASWPCLDSLGSATLPNITPSFRFDLPSFPRRSFVQQELGPSVMAFLG